MNKYSNLELEILSGPLDGHIVSLNSATEWTRKLDSPLSFPWDTELGEPQAYFKSSENGWQLESANTRRGTHVLRQEAEVRLPVILQVDDVIKAGNTWMRIKSIL